MKELSYIENLFLQADEAINRNALGEAKELLEEILAIDPTYGRAYNYLGWLYANKIIDFQKAKSLYRLGLKYTSDYPALYINYGYLLIEMAEYDAALDLIGSAREIYGIDQATLTYQEARIAELLMDIKLAVKLYKLAGKQTLDDNFMNYLNTEIKRVKRKTGLVMRFLL